MPASRTVQKLAALSALVVLAGLSALAVLGTAGCGKSKPSALAVSNKVEEATVTLTIRSYPQGSGSLTRHEVNDQTGSEKILDPSSGKLLTENKLKRSNEVEYVDQVVEPGTKQPKLIRRDYTRAVDNIDGVERKLAYEGRTIVFEFKDGKYEAAAVGQPPIPEQDLALLARRVSRPDFVQVYLPSKPVAAGETWTIDMSRAALVMADGLEVDVNKSSGSGRFTKAYMKPGLRSLFGVIEFDLKFAVITRMFQDKQKLAWEPGTFLDFKGSIETAIDGSTTEGTMSVKGKFSGKSGHFFIEGKKVSMASDMEFSSHQERSAEK